MKKYFILSFVFIISASLAFANTDFFQFGNGGRNNNWQNNNINNEMNSNINMNRNNWSNPYDTGYNNPFSKVFKMKNSMLPTFRNTDGYSKTYTDKYSTRQVKDSDLEYLLSKMERNRFGQSYTNLDIDNRLDRLDSQMFGAIQSGDYKTRLNRLKHAFSAESSRSYKAKKEKLSRFKEMFTSGSPTSMPADNDYYSSLENSFSAW